MFGFLRYLKFNNVYPEDAGTSFLGNVMLESKKTNFSLEATFK
jgi:hypothetical protein